VDWHGILRVQQGGKLLLVEPYANAGNLPMSSSMNEEINNWQSGLLFNPSKCVSPRNGLILSITFRLLEANKATS
jgi:hypothetical protein